MPKKIKKRCLMCGHELHEELDIHDDQIGKAPKFKSIDDDLRTILHITRDKRSHVMWDSAFAWEKVKQKAIASLARRILNAHEKAKKKRKVSQ